MANIGLLQTIATLFEERKERRRKAKINIKMYKEVQDKRTMELVLQYSTAHIWPWSGGGCALVHKSLLYGTGCFCVTKLIVKIAF